MHNVTMLYLGHIINTVLLVVLGVPGKFSKREEVFKTSI